MARTGTAGATELSRLLGPGSAKKLAEEIGVSTTEDLLRHFPRRYIERGELSSIADLPLGEQTTLVARVVSASTRRMQSRRGFLTEVEVTDDSGAARGLLSVTFFNGHKAAKELAPGRRVMLSGKVGNYRGRATLSHPDYELLPPDDDGQTEPDLRPLPIYPATARLPSWRIRAAVATLLDVLAPQDLADPIPAEVLAAERLEDLATALRDIHRPDTLNAAQRARARFRFEEAFLLQTVLATRRARRAMEPSVPRLGDSSGLLDAFDASLPFNLTDGQNDVGRDIAADLSRSHPMNRLLQGEVGTGKTVVALRGILQVVESGGQVAFMAPTEVLAEQHYRSILALLGPLGLGGTLAAAEHACSIALLTGSLSAAERRRVLLGAASGAIDIVVGTHALVSDMVKFADLGLLVVDEQHRFGVEQRDALRTRGDYVPHVLVMTATPIPRTLAMTVFGDLETSTLTELPAGRSPLKTYVAGLAENPQWEGRIWARCREEIDAGRQVFVVCPRIGDETAAPPAGEQQTASVVETLERLRCRPELSSARMEALHGGLTAPQRDTVMGAFASGDMDLVVATTVVEVGVNVPNATMMVILDADRFGVSQLHQLRGRVGRGAHGGTCLLVTSLVPGHPSRERLDVVASTTDGMRLSAYDVESRKEGDVLGAAQSGHGSGLKLLRVIRDGAVIERARARAGSLVDADPVLDGHPALRAAVDSLDDERKEYLERA